MSVTDGQRASASVLNSAFVSRTAASTVVDVITLADTTASSGSSVTNVQKAINETTFSTVSTQSISAGGTINVTDYKGMQYRRVVGNSAAVTCSTTPFGGSAHNIPDGTLIRLVGQDDSATVSITHNDANYGCILNGNVTLKKYDVLTLQWDSFLVRYIEVGRNF